MRLLLTILTTLFFLAGHAQTPLTFGGRYNAPWQQLPVYHPLTDSSHLSQKWYFNKYIGLSAGYGFYNGGNAMILSVPVGLQLIHPLNNNLSAFAGVSVAPAFFNFNSAFVGPLANKSYPGGNFSNAYGFGMDSRIEMGLIYTNEERTFSISGSIGVDRYSNPGYPAYPPQQRMNAKNVKRN